MLKFLKKKQKRNIEVLKLEYDLIFKILLFINAIFLVYLSSFNKVSYKDFTVWNLWDFITLFLVLMFLFVDLWILNIWFKLFSELRDKLSKK